MFTQKNSPDWLITFCWMGLLVFVSVGGAASIKILFSDLRPQPSVHNEVTVQQEIKIDRRTDCKFSLVNCSGGNRQ